MATGRILLFRPQKRGESKGKAYHMIGSYLSIAR